MAKRSIERALAEYQRDQRIHDITALMVQQSLSRRNKIADEGDLIVEPAFIPNEAIPQDEARQAFILQDILRQYTETYYPEFFIELNENDENDPIING